MDTSLSSGYQSTEETERVSECVVCVVGVQAYVCVCVCVCVCTDGWYRLLLPKCSLYESIHCNSTCVEDCFLCIKLLEFYHH